MDDLGDLMEPYLGYNKDLEETQVAPDAEKISDYYECREQKTTSRRSDSHSVYTWSFSDSANIDFYHRGEIIKNVDPPRESITGSGHSACISGDIAAVKVGGARTSHGKGSDNVSTKTITQVVSKTNVEGDQSCPPKIWYRI